MDSKEIQEILKLVNRLELAEFKYKQGETEFSVRTKFYSKSRSFDMVPTYNTMPPAGAVPPPSPPTPQVSSQPKTNGDDDGAKATQPVSGNLIEIRSPIVGTFYRSASPDKPVLVKPGDVIEVGTVLCIVEAMKLFNEIESEVAGKIVKVVAEDASPVEYDQLLFLIDPNG